MSLTPLQVGKILARHEGNEHRTASDLAEYWVASTGFVPMTIRAGNPELGIHPETTGDSYTTGPIIVDVNKRGIYYTDASGRTPDFVVLDGQHRVLAARRRGPCATIEALVGDHIVGRLRLQDRKIANECRRIDENVRAYLQAETPGRYLARLQLAVQKGMLSPHDLKKLRQAWHANHGI